MIVRTLEIGADKPAPWLTLAAEENPALGLRGIRLQLARRDLLETQLRALLGVRTEGVLSTLLPLVADQGELGAARELPARHADAAALASSALCLLLAPSAPALHTATLSETAAVY